MHIEYLRNQIVKVCVLGAGVVGATAAYFLSREGHDVAVIDRQDGAGLETSFANGGQISASQAAPWAAPNAPFLMLRWLGKVDAPLLYHLRADPILWRWSINFLFNCTSVKWQNNTAKNLKLALYSRQLMRKIRSQTRIDYDTKSVGILKIFRTPKELDNGVAHASMLRQLNCNNQVLSQKSCFALEPALEENGEEILGGIHSPDDESGDAYTFTRKIALNSLNKGAKFYYGEDIKCLKSEGDIITSVETHKGRHQADIFVVSLGSYSPLLLKPLNIRLPIYPTKGYSVTIPTSNGHNAPNVSITDEDNKIVYSRLGNRLRVAGTAEFSGYDMKLNKDRARTILNKAKTQFPNGGDFKNSSLWTGLRPLTPDGMPVIGKTTFRNLYLNTGHGTLGWTMCAGSGKLLADLVNGISPEIDAKAFRPDRF